MLWIAIPPAQDRKNRMIKLVNNYTKEIIKKLGDSVDTLILVGSFSRGEEAEGLSDIEFWAVVKDLSKTEKPKINNNVSLGFTTRKHLKKLKPYIYTLEVKKFGKVIFGDADILSLIPNYSYEDIRPIDGFILLNNRIVEQLILLNKIQSGQEVNQYEFDKGYIQLVNSLLVINRQYESLYPEKLKVFRKIYKGKDVGLLNKAEEAFASINHLQDAIASAPMVPHNDVNPEEALKKWLELREYFRATWLEEKQLFCRLISKPLRFWVYYRASKLYFSDKHQNRTKRDNVIKNWEKFVK